MNSSFPPENASAHLDRHRAFRDGSWDHLTPVPRSIPADVRWRLIGDEFGAVAIVLTGMAALIFVGGFVVLIGGGGSAPGSSLPPRWVGALLIIAAAGLVGLVYRLLVSASKTRIQLLKKGEPVSGEIVEVLDRTTGNYRPYADLIEEWSKFQATGFLSGMLGGFLGRQLRNWPVRIRLTEGEGGEARDARLDLWPRLKQLDENPKTDLLADPGSRPLRGIELGRVPWLGVSARGEWMVRHVQDVGRRSWLRSLGHALLVVVPTYCLAAWGASQNSGSMFAGGADAGVPPLLGAFVVVLFTLTHGVVPVFFYKIFHGATQAMRKMSSGVQPATILFGGFTYLHMGFWYGVPIIALGVMTGWYSLGWAAVHLLFARPGWRTWVFLEHGSTAMALLLFLILFSGASLFPVGIAVAVCQSLLLTIVEWKGRPLWTGMASVGQ